MIKSFEHAIAVQTKRRLSGKKGRSKAVRRWFTRTYRSPAIEVSYTIFTEDQRHWLSGNFDGCRRYDEVHVP